MRFVVQQHKARSVHFDFRLEVEDVAVSWAVPRGFSYDTRERRLAVPVEDHALGSLVFEGVHRGGGGPVVVWDAGTYRSLAEHDGPTIAVRASLDAGHLPVWLDGHKLVGGWALIRTAAPPDARWVLVKMRDEHADPARDPVRDQPRSVLSGRTLEEVAAAGEGATSR